MVTLKVGTVMLGVLLIPLLFRRVTGSQLQLFTEPSSQALLGSGALLKCWFDVGGTVDLNALRVRWYLWEEKIAQYDQGRGESQTGVSMSEQELGKGNASLSLSRVTVSDEGPYKCIVGYGTEQLQGEVIFRVLAIPRLSTPQQSAVTDTASSFPCHVWGFYPGDVVVAWLRDGQVMTDTTRSAPQRNPDGTFNLTLTYTFTPTASDSGSVFSCRANHSALPQPLQEEFTLDVTGADHTSFAIGTSMGILVAGGAVAAMAIYCWRKRQNDREAHYSVSKMQGPQRYLLGQEVTLSCSMQGAFPKDMAVTWERIQGGDRMVIGGSKAKERPEKQSLLHPRLQGWRASEERSGTCLTASLTFTPTVQDDGVRVRCSFHHEAQGIRDQRESKQIKLWARPRVSGIQVLQRWEPRDQVPFAVQIQNFYPREIHRIQWCCDGTAWETSEPTDYSQNPDLTFNATSIFRVPSDGLNSPDLRVRVSVQQSPKEPPMEREIRARDTGLLRPPEVSEICKPKSVMAREETTLSCRVAGHFPGALSVSWLRKEKTATVSHSMQKGQRDTLVLLENSPEYRIYPGAPLTQDGKSFQQESRLSFTPSVQRDQGAEYVCRVGHVALQTPTERCSGNLQVTVFAGTSTGSGAQDNSSSCLIS